MKFKPTLVAVAVSTLALSVQAQVLTKEIYNAKGALNTTMYKAYTTGTGVTLAWDRNITGLGVKVAVLDSGFDLSHSDLKGQVVASKNFSEIVVENTKTNTNNFASNIQNKAGVNQGSVFDTKTQQWVNKTTTATDITWSIHGTQMASIVAGRKDGEAAVGVAPDARLLLAQVGQGVTYDSKTKTWTNSDTGISTSAVINALSWAEANGATVANMSFGSNYDKTFQKGTWNSIYKFLNGSLPQTKNSAGLPFVSGTISGLNNKDTVIFGNNTKETYQVNTQIVNKVTTTTFTLLNKNTTYSNKDGYTIVGDTTDFAKTAIFNDGKWTLTNGVFTAMSTYGSMYGSTTKDLLAFAGASKTMALVAAAGNQGLPYAHFPGAYATQVDSKGNLVLGGRMLIVGSVGDNNVISSFSNRAGSFCTNLSGTVCKDPYYVKDFFVVAPGEGIVSAIPTQTKTCVDINKNPVGCSNPVSGTSPAAAFVSGGIALMKQAWPQLSGAQLVNLVKTTATDLGTKGVDEVYGYGLVNFDKATLPTGTVKYTTQTLSTSTVVAGTPVVNVSISATGSLGSAMKGSSVLSNVQVVDNISRNYTADFTQAIGNSSPVNSLAMSPYLAMQGTGYREFGVPFGKTDTISFMSSSNGVAAQYETAYNDTRVSLQVGSMTEANGFLNNHGTGLTSFGNSGTTWAMVGGEKDIGANFSVLGNYGVGITKTGSVQNSMIALSPTLVSDTWKLGIAKNNIFFSGKTNDKLSLSVQGPVAVRRGHADVTAVTGYNYTTDTEDNTSATPISSTERVNLALGKRETNLILGYNVQVQNQTYVGFAVGRQFNANGVNANTVAFTVRSVF